MATGRNPKRARQKDRQAARRDEWRREYMRRRRQKRILGLGTIVVLLAVVAVVLFTVHPLGLLKPKKPAPTATPFAAQSMTVPKKTPVACGASLPSSAGSVKTTYQKPADEHLSP